MTILVIPNLYPLEDVGGYEPLCAQRCRPLQARGHRITILTTLSRGDQS